MWTKPDEGGFNSYNPTAYAEDLSEYLFDPLTQYNPQTGEYLPHAATDWSIDGQTVTVSLLEGHTDTGAVDTERGVARAGDRLHQVAEPRS